MVNQIAGGHAAVLLDEVLDGLNVRAGGNYIDGTLGAGGHTAAILAASGPDGRVLAFERDAGAIALAQENLSAYGDRLEVVHASYATLGETARSRGFGAVDGILLDLGLSSMQLADRSRGFSFLADGPLDMRFDAGGVGPTAADLLNTFSESELANIIFNYGEDRYARRIARAIVAARPVQTVKELVEVVSGAVPRSKNRNAIHPATRTFQALRIAVNGELDALADTLPQSLDLLKPDGRLAVISFHSLEDRIVKQFIRQQALDCVCPPRQPICTCDTIPTLQPVTRKPLTAGESELHANPRSRSAKLRVAQKLKVEVA